MSKQIEASLSIPFDRLPGCIPLYVPQLITAELEDALTVLLRALNQFQIRAFQTKPLKAKKTRRLIYGLQECLKHQRGGHLKALIIASDLDEGVVASEEYLEMTQQSSIPIIYGLRRKDLAKAITANPRTRIAFVGVLSADGALEKLNDLIQQASDLAKAWTEQYIELARGAQKFQVSPIWLAAAFGHSEVVAALLDENPPLYDATGDSMLHITASRGHLPMVKFLVATKVGARMLLLRNKLEQYPVHLAAMFGHRAVFDLLRECVPETFLNARDITQRTMFDYARLNGW